MLVHIATIFWYALDIEQRNQRSWRKFSSKVSSWAIVIIFFRSCVPEMFVTSYSVTYCLCVPGKPGICFHYYCAVYDKCEYSDTFWLADRARLFAQYTISLSSLCKFIWRHWTYKMPVRYILSSVWVRWSIFSPLSIIQCVGLFFFSSLPISLGMIEIICILCLIIIIKSEVWTITHCLGLGHETMVSAVCLSIFLWICCPGSQEHSLHFEILIVGGSQISNISGTLSYLPYTWCNFFWFRCGVVGRCVAGWLVFMDMVVVYET